MELREEFKKRLAFIKVFPDEEQFSKLEVYLTELERWNKRFSFIKASPEELWLIHLIDVLAGLSLIKERLVLGGKILDFGSGAGFPGIPLALFLKNFHFVLCERKTKEQIFLKNIIIRLKLENVDVISGLKEAIEGGYQAIICRAVASLRNLYSQLVRYLAKEGFLFTYKGKEKKIKEELTALSFNIKDNLRSEVVKLELPFFKAERHIVLIFKE